MNRPDIVPLGLVGTFSEKRASGGKSLGGEKPTESFVEVNPNKRPIRPYIQLIRSDIQGFKVPLGGSFGSCISETQ